MTTSYDLSSLDLAIVGTYLGMTIALGLYLSRKHEGTEDYFLAGRRMIWPFVGLSLFASNISSTTLIGLAGDAYSTGISVYNYEWTSAIVLVLFAVFFLPQLLRSRVFTLPEFLERRYSRFCRSYFSILTIFLNIVVDTAGSLYAGGLLITLILPDVPIWLVIAGLAVVAGVYTIAGGLAAVVYTDAIQAILLIFGSILISVFAFNEAGGLQHVLSEVPSSKLSLIRPLDDPSVPWLGLLTGVMLLGFYFWCTNQFIAQRVLSAKSIDHGRRGVLFAGLLKIPVLFVMVLPGTAAILLYPDLDRADLVYPTMLFDLLPVGILGLVCAGFVAALMSQIDSTLNSASTLVTIDFVKTRFPDISDRRLMQIGRVVTGIFMLLAVCWAPQIANFESLFKYLQKILSYAIPPALSLFVVGLFWARANAAGAKATIFVGTIAGASLFWLNEIADVMDLHFLYIVPILFLLSVATHVTVSFTSRHRFPAGDPALLWSREQLRTDDIDTGGPWYTNFTLQASALIALALGVVFAFR